jgi:glucose/arabinose dehydrogenase
MSLLRSYDQSSRSLSLFSSSVAAQLHCIGADHSRGASRDFPSEHGWLEGAHSGEIATNQQLAGRCLAGRLSAAGSPWIQGFRVCQRLHRTALVGCRSQRDVFVADSAIGEVVVLHDPQGQGSAQSREIFADHLNLPFGIAFHDDYVYAADTN